MKKKMKALNALYPTPTVLIGTVVEGKPNFIAIAHIGIMTLTSISLGIHKSHYSNDGIREHKTFSVNIPSENLIVKTDYCGMVSGRKADKGKLFTLFYGDLPMAPMIEECPVTMECTLHSIVDMKTHDVFVGEIVNTYASEEVLNEGKIDIAKVKPLLFDMSSKKYWALGGELGTCWHMGQQLKQS
jgi:flavin reductase (DIM6/NTAB) family NADH-FMN oxidoreductase RutF